MDAKKRDGEMLHLRIERLAELADGEPTAPEREHVAECEMCATELAAYRRVVAMAADERRRIAPPLTQWGSLALRLRQEGIATVAAPAAARSGAGWSHRASRAAAALLLMAGGTLAGRLSAGLPLGQALGARADEDAALTREEFQSTSDALSSLQAAQQAYERAAQYLAVNDTSTSEESSQLYRTRLAALDEMAGASLRVLEQTPADPVMNQVYYSTLGLREMTLNKLGTALPVGARLTRF